MKITNKSICTIIVSFCIFTVLASLPFSKADNEDNNKSSNTAPSKHTDLIEENEEIKKYRQKYPQLWKPRMSHGNASEGLAAFLKCEQKQFKSNEPVSVMFGIVYLRIGKPITVQPPYFPYRPEELSWFSIIGTPDGIDVPYKGFIGLSFRPGPERAIRLGVGCFCGMWCNLRMNYKFDTPGIYTIEWNYFMPNDPNVSWWQGHIISNEMKIEILP
ncbi:MAG: hypothetical protein ACYS32_16110 [Planctomycetota bacterium]